MQQDPKQLLQQLKSLTAELQGSETKWQAIVQGAPVVLFVLDRDGIFTMSEGQGLKTLGLNPGEVVGRSIFDIYAHNEEIKAAARIALGGGFLTQVMAEDDTVWLTQFQPQEIGGVIGVATDITKEFKLEQELEETANRLSAILEAAIDGIITIDEQGDIAYPLNPAAAKMFGYTVGELVGKPVGFLMPKEYRHHHEEGIRNYLKTGVSKIIGTTRTVEGLHRNGKTFPIDLSVSEAEVAGKRLFTAFIRKNKCKCPE